MGDGPGLLVDVVGTGVRDVVRVRLLVVVVGSGLASWADMYPSGIYRMVPSGLSPSGRSFSPPSAAVTLNPTSR